MLSLLNFNNEPISIKGVNITDTVKKHILENNYCESDLSLLISNYENESQDIKTALLALFTSNIEAIIESNVELPFNLLLSLLQSSSVTDREELLASQLTSITREQSIACFSILEMNELLTVFEGKWPIIEISDTQTSILKIMEAKRCISSFAEDDNKSGYCYYRVREKE